MAASERRKKQMEQYIKELQRRYRNEKDRLSTITQLVEMNSDIPINNLTNYIRKLPGVDGRAAAYYRKLGILCKHLTDDQEFVYYEIEVAGAEKTYFYLTDRSDMKAGDMVIVDVGGGEKEGKILSTHTYLGIDAPRPPEDTKKILRKKGERRGGDLSAQRKSRLTYGLADNPHYAPIDKTQFDVQTKAVSGKDYHYCQAYLRGYDEEIEKLRDYLDEQQLTGEFAELADGVSELRLDECDLFYLENRGFSALLKKFPVLKVTALRENWCGYGIEAVYSGSGYIGWTECEEVGDFAPDDDGGDGRWASNEDMMQPINTSFIYTKTGAVMPVHYIYPYAELWDDGVYYREEKGVFYEKMQGDTHNDTEIKAEKTSEVVPTENTAVPDTENRLQNPAEIEDAFQKVEKHFLALSKKEIQKSALENILGVVNLVGKLELENVSLNSIIGLILICIKVGICGDGVINKQEKELLQYVLDSGLYQYVDDNMVTQFLQTDFDDAIYNHAHDDATVQFLQNDPNGAMYNFLQGISVALPEESVSVLILILCFAYIDGKLEKDVATRLKDIFAIQYRLLSFSYEIDEMYENMPDEALETLILEGMAEEADSFSASDLCNRIPALKQISTQKVSTLLRKLEADGKLVRKPKSKTVKYYVKEAVYREVVHITKTCKLPGKLQHALDLASLIPGYLDVETYCDTCRAKILQPAYNDAVKLYETAKTEKEYAQAAAAFAELGTYQDSVELHEKCLAAGEELLNAKKYASAKKLYRTAQTLPEFQKAAEAFEAILTYKDSAELREQCLQHRQEMMAQSNYEAAQTFMANARTPEEYQKAAKLFKMLRNYRDGAEKEKECLETAERISENQRKDQIYQAARAKASSDNVTVLHQAEQEFASITNWRDAGSQAAKCRSRIEYLQAEQQKADWRAQRLCQHCGGEFKGLFIKTCRACGRKKDY